jgi:hypothetical protein
MLCSVLLLASSHALFSRQEFRNNLLRPGLTSRRAYGALGHLPGKDGD